MICLLKNSQQGHVQIDGDSRRVRPMELEIAKRQLRRLEAAEGYLLLEMAERALTELNAIRAENSAFVFEWYSLHAEACRQLERFDDALSAYAVACDQRPADARLLSGMAWCFKRTEQLPQAIVAAEKAYHADPSQAVLLYNLACYYTLADDKALALSWLGRALRMDAELCRRIPLEPDFDSLRNDDDFQFIVAAAAGLDQS